MDLPQTLRPGLGLRIPQIVVAIGGIGFGLFLAGHGALLLFREDEVGWGELFGGGALVVVGVVLLRMARARLDVDDEGLTIVNPVRSERVPWVLVDHFEVGWAYNGISLVRADGRRLRIHAIQKSNLAHWSRQRSRADNVVKALNVVAGRRRSSLGLQTEPD